MNKPKLPQKPVKPTLDKIPLYSEKTEIVFQAKKCCSLVDLSSAIEKYKNPKYEAYLNLSVEADVDYYDCDDYGGQTHYQDYGVLLQIEATTKTEFSQEERENNLKNLIKQYERDLKDYEKDCASYDKKVEKYNEWLKNKKQQELKKLEENQQKEIKRLEEQKKKLEKRLKKLEVET